MNFVKIHFLALLFFINGAIFAQQKPSPVEISGLPAWAQEMYRENPNVFVVDSLYQAYYKVHPFVKSFHTQYYKRWKRRILDYVAPNGYANLPTPLEWDQKMAQYAKKQPAQKSSPWRTLGPFQVSAPQGGQGKTQTNVYCIAQSRSNSAVLYCGTEPGEVFKSTDGGNNWTCVSLGYFLGNGVSSVAIHPTNPDIVFVGGNVGVFRSMDGGQTWERVLTQTGWGVHELLVHPTDAQLVFAATDNGFFRSTNGGSDWGQLYAEKTYDVKCNAANAAEMYLVKNNPALVVCEFYRSTDSGATWTLQSNGWYKSTHPGRSDAGARIAVTPANPKRVYAYLIGEAKTDDYGYIGVYRSNDGGQSWSLPGGPPGGPYSGSHPNLAYGWPSWTYHQGFYNCAIMASETNADQILVGGLNLWRSDNGGQNFSSVAGYIAGPLNMHVDMQDFRAYNGAYWITTDGGIYRSRNFFNSQPSFSMQGVRGSDYWGFGSGWNEDVLVGGLYHNGDLAHHENYGLGKFLALGGGEEATGYVNPGDNRKAYFSDLGGIVLPLSLSDPLSYFSASKFPNQSYGAAESSEMEFHPNCYNIAFIGKDHKLWKTTDGGASYTLVKTFGTNEGRQVKYIEISSSNPNVLYVTQQSNSSSPSTLWKTTDGGANWVALSRPNSNSRRMLITINPLDENELWLAYPDGSNNNKIFKTTDGGTTWTNWTTPTLNNEPVHAIVHIAGTDGGVYYCTDLAVYYRNATMSDWAVDNTGLPTYCNTNIARPFYRDGKIRIATYGKGIWENDFHEAPSTPIARISVDRLGQDVQCQTDLFYFEDYSFLNHHNASWQWTFENGSPASSTLRNPVVQFTGGGIHKVILTVTDRNGRQSTDTLDIVIHFFPAPSQFSQDFESGAFPASWSVYDDDLNGAWVVTANSGGYGQSKYSAVFNNFDIDTKGTFDDLRLLVSTQSAPTALSFDVAYAPGGPSKSDTLEVLASLDCGQTFSKLYRKSGEALATAPAIQGAFVPTADQWRTDTVSLAAYLNQPQVMLAFRNWGGPGNNLYLDNINLKTATTHTTSPIGEVPFRVYPNPVKAGGQIHVDFPAPAAGTPATLKIRDMNGREVFSSPCTPGQPVVLPPGTIKAGHYMLNVETEQKIWNVVLVVG